MVSCVSVDGVECPLLSEVSVGDGCLRGVKSAYCNVVLKGERLNMDVTE